VRNKKKFEIMGSRGKASKKLTRDFIREATQRFLEKGGVIEQLNYWDKLTDIHDEGVIEIRQSHPVIDTTVTENKWGWGQH